MHTQFQARVKRQKQIQILQVYDYLHGKRVRANSNSN